MSGASDSANDGVTAMVGETCRTSPAEAESGDGTTGAAGAAWGQGASETAHEGEADGATAVPASTAAELLTEAALRPLLSLVSP